MTTFPLAVAMLVLAVVVMVCKAAMFELVVERAAVLATMPVENCDVTAFTLTLTLAILTFVVD